MYIHLQGFQLDVQRMGCKLFCVVFPTSERC